ncbi:amidohydrolase family protein [Cellulomonas sp. P22]|uniref:amidohydrolase family protein n=1 Tax=Cellulomonas sp. P22 TaxID=3373189 RepID=UPI003796B7DB
MITTITDARLFDGVRVLDATTVTLEGDRIVDVGGPVSSAAEVVDARGATLLPGLIDAHVHTSERALAQALRFGVTTELEMQGAMTGDTQRRVGADPRLADVRSSGFALTPPGGHPSELFPAGERPGGPPRSEGPAPVMPFVTTPDEAVAWIPRLVDAGSDYIKLMIDDGTVEGHPGLPCLDQATVDAAVREAHRLGRITVAHALTIDATMSAVRAGVDGLTHLFMDRPHTPEVVAALASSGAFVVPCLVLDASMMGLTGEAFAADPRVSSRLDPAWLATLRSSIARYPVGNLDDVLASAAALHSAGVDLLVGTDASVPVPYLGGVAHGASVHHELQLLVRAGLTPVEALSAATSVPARRFGLDDRGRIAPGLRADLLLVDGDPTTRIADTLALRTVWRAGVASSL